MRWDGPPLEAWDAWRPDEIARRLAGLRAPWYVVGGWAIDLFLGAQTRHHEDLEIAIPRTDFPEVRAQLADFALYVVGDGEVRALKPDELPPAEHHQNWVLDPRANAWRVDVMLEPGDARTWIFRRDESIHAPRDQMVGRSADG
ncbi:MAG: nucleotidyltransferase domain-containing protein, partial [Myxococcota bacterium]